MSIFKSLLGFLQQSFNWWSLVSTSLYQIITVGIQGNQMDLVLIRLVDISINELIPDHHCRYTGSSDGSGFNQIGGHY